MYRGKHYCKCLPAHKLRVKAQGRGWKALLTTPSINPVIGARSMRSKVEGSTDSIFHFMKWGQSSRPKVKDIDNCAFPYIITEVIWCCRLHYTPTLRSLCEISCFGLNREVTLCELPSNHFPLLPQAEMIRVTPYSEALPHTIHQQNFFLWYPVVITRKKHEKKRWCDLKKWSTHPFWRGKIPFKKCAPALRWDKEECKGPSVLIQQVFMLSLSGILICLTDLC